MGCYRGPAPHLDSPCAWAGPAGPRAGVGAILVLVAVLLLAAAFFFLSTQSHLSAILRECSCGRALVSVAQQKQCQPVLTSSLSLSLLSSSSAGSAVSLVSTSPENSAPFITPFTASLIFVGSR